MRKSHKVAVAVCVCMVIAVFSAGCAKKAVPNTSGQGPAETTLTPETSKTADVPTSTEPGGPITTPVTGTVLRTQLMDAARAKLGTTSQFVVYQLFVQGDQAVGDLEAASGGQRQFVVFKGPEWTGVWVAPFGASSASAASAKEGVPGISEELLSRIDWKFTKPVSDEAMVSSLSSKAKGWAKTLMDGQGEPYVITSVKVAKDNNGGWWGRAIVQPTASASGSFESIDYWCEYSAGAWTGQAQDPEPPAPSTFFPSSVIGSLGF